jgi:hypothetical protein
LIVCLGTRSSDGRKTKQFILYVEMFASANSSYPYLGQGSIIDIITLTSHASNFGGTKNNGEIFARSV